MRSKRNSTLVLGGGGIGGAFSISALLDCDDVGRHCHIAGTSIGALIGAMLIQGMSPADIRGKLLLAPPKFGEPGELGFLARLERGLGSFMGVPIGITSALEDRSTLLRFVQDCLPYPEAAYRPYADEFIVTVYDAEKGVVVDSRDLLNDHPSLSLATVVVMSCLVPGIFTNAGRYLDGGLGANVPLFYAYRRWRDINACVIANGGRYIKDGLVGDWNISKAAFLYPTMQSCQTELCLIMTPHLYPGKTLAIKGNFSAGFLDDATGSSDAFYSGRSRRNEVTSWYSAIKGGSES